MPPTTASLTLRALLHDSAARAGLGGSSSSGGSISGLTPPAQALAAAVLAGGGPVVVVVPGDAAVDGMVTDARFFLAGLEGLARGDVERGVLPFSSPEVDPYRGMTPHLDVASSRARALAGMALGQARIVVASAVSLLPRISPPDRLLLAAVDLRLGGSYSPVDLADRLVDAGFTRRDPVEAHGEFCGRGGVVDMFPAGETFPIRAEFVGDNIESLRRFDPATQRSVASLDHVAVRPLTEQLERVAGGGDPEQDESATDRSGTFDDYVRRASARFVVTEPSEVADRLRQAAEQIRASYADAAARDDPAPPPATLQVDDGEAAAWLAGATTLDALEIGEPLPDGAAPAGHQIGRAHV